jgi:bifunctional non-homologous end joining protein LigD
MLPRLSPMQLGRKSDAFDHPEWIFELKLDGFRSLAYIEDGSCRLISRRNNAYKSFDPTVPSTGTNLCRNERDF